MSKLFSRKIGIAVVATLVSLSASAADQYGTADEAVSLVHKVEAKIASDGLDATLKAITAKQFNDRDLYPFVFTDDGVALAHGANPALVGKNLSGLKDQDGKFMIQDSIKVAQSGKPGWVDFKWPNPLTNKIAQKSTYIEPIGSNFIGVGIYK